MRGRKGLVRYYIYVLLTLTGSLGAVFSNNLIVFVVFWGFLGLLLYLLVGFGQRKNTAYTAKKTFIIVGGTDAVMLFGIAIIWHLTGALEMDKISIGLNSPPAILAYLCLAAGAFAKAGAMPFHTWVPDAAEDGPTPVTAFLPASLDKLLGIYFLARISLDMFRMNLGMNTFLMVVGSVTIVAAVMMALIQHDMKRLLGYHAVSQVGYMVLGIGTGNPVGIAGGLFHMLNHAIYKSCLFFSGGAVEKRSGTTNLDK
ncbi:MAG: proton-conducting transporter membrane subunit, partial [Candidatus Omnitrophota bacterium]